MPLAAQHAAQWNGLGVGLMEGSVGGVVVCVYRVAHQWLVSAALVGRDRGRRLNFVCPGCPVYVCRLVHVCTEVA